MTRSACMFCDDDRPRPAALIRRTPDGYPICVPHLLHLVADEVDLLGDEVDEVAATLDDFGVTL